MWRRTNVQFQVSSAKSQESITFTSPYNLLRVCLKSITLKVKSGHARRFLTNRLIAEWRRERGATDAHVQRLNMERAGTFVSALHKPKDLKQGEPIQYDFSKPGETPESKPSKSQHARWSENPALTAKSRVDDGPPIAPAPPNFSQE